MIAASPPRTDVAARWWAPLADGRIECRLCPRACKLRDGQRGFCTVRQRIGDRLWLTAYGRPSGFQVDPIEKKPLYHFRPGTEVLSFGTIGCNLGCRFCQNWHLSKATAFNGLGERASPAGVAKTAKSLGCPTVAFTYNDPVIFAEYAIDVAQACHEAGLETVAVTAGYISADAGGELFGAMDAVNVDLKAFSDAFYRRLCLGRLQPVLETLAFLHRQTSAWLEVTTLLIPGENDGDDELARAAEWFVSTLGCDVPWHFTAYHPDFKLRAPPTPLASLHRARDIARRSGIHYVYTGNVRDDAGACTTCPQCGTVLIERCGYQISWNDLVRGRCPSCGREIAGRWQD